MSKIPTIVKALLTLILLSPALVLYSQTKVQLMGPPPCGWDISCSSSMLTQTDTYVWEATFNFEPGTYEYKVVEDGNWAKSYPIDNMKFSITVAGPVHFTYNSQTKVVSSDYDLDPPPGPTKVAVVGSIQGAAFCGWDPNCSTSTLTQQTGTDTWTGTFTVNAGCWEYRVVEDGDWAKAYPLNNLILSIATTGQVTFTYNSRTRTLSSNYDVAICPLPDPTKVTVVGTIQGAAFCGWEPNCSTSKLNKTGTDTWTGTFTVNAGCWEYKVVENGNWAYTYPWGDNTLKLYIAETGLVTFTYNSTTKAISSDHDVLACPPPLPSKVVIAGTFQNELGCTNGWGGDWEPDCMATMLYYNSSTGLWSSTITVPAGCQQYKVTINGSWGENYGENGVPGGANIQLYVPVSGPVTFTYDHTTHLVTTTPYASGFKPECTTVTLPGSFQTEAGCTGDWDPSCNKTNLTYNSSKDLYEGDITLPAGCYEYKVVHNGDWAVNFGKDGAPNGNNYVLSVPGTQPVVVHFTYNPYTHVVNSSYNVNQCPPSICINKFYDANINGIKDSNEPGLPGVTFTISGVASGTVTTGANGTACYNDLPQGEYQVTETVPEGYYATGATSKSFYLYGQYAMEVGNVCLGPGGAKGMGYWMSKNGRDVLMDNGTMEPELESLRIMYLRNADGSEFDPYTYEQFQEWLKKANASNMAYMLSAQLAVMYLNMEAGFVQGGSYVYTPGCGYLGEGNFNSLYGLYYQVFYNLWWNGYTPAGNPERANQECLKNALDMLNNNHYWVQAQPCTLAMTEANRNTEEVILPLTGVTLWPNPASSQFSLKVTGESSEPVFVKVYDANGRLVHSLNGTTNRVYQFGEQFRSGIYFAEIIRGKERTTKKLIKQ